MRQGIMLITVEVIDESLIKKILALAINDKKETIELKQRRKNKAEWKSG